MNTDCTLLHPRATRNAGLFERPKTNRAPPTKTETPRSRTTGMTPRAFIQNKTNTCYRVIKGVGAGQFGTAFLVEEEGKAGVVHCAKEIILRGRVDDAKREAVQEVKLMRETCNHPNIVSYVDSWLEARPGQKAFIVLMEYCSSGSLDKLISKVVQKEHKFNEKRIMHYMQELSGALQYCHDDLHIVHRDLKPANVLIDYTGSLKLADFGLAKLLGASSDLCVTYCGSPLYMSPEQCNGQTYSFPADMWGLGCILYELMSLHSPWRDPAFEGVAVYNTVPEVVRRIRTTTPRYSHLRNLYPLSLIDLARWLLQRDAEKRWTASQVCGILSMRAPPPSFPEGMSATHVLQKEENEEALRDLAALLIQKSFRSSFKNKHRLADFPEQNHHDNVEMNTVVRCKTVETNHPSEFLFSRHNVYTTPAPPPSTKHFVETNVTPVIPPLMTPNCVVKKPMEGYTRVQHKKTAIHARYNNMVSKEGMSRIEALAQPRHRKMPSAVTPVTKFAPKRMVSSPPGPQPVFPVTQHAHMNYIRPAWAP